MLEAFNFLGSILNGLLLSEFSFDDRDGDFWRETFNNFPPF